jgi:hypothetical protein
MQTLSLALSARVSLTLFEDAGEWRFAAWYDGIPLPPPPEAAHLSFGSPLAAADYFRALHRLNTRKDLTELFLDAA